MTGQPQFRFRGTDENPECVDCGTQMVFLEQREGTYHDRDVYGCGACGTTFEDRWTF